MYYDVRLYHQIRTKDGYALGPEAIANILNEKYPDNPLSDTQLMAIALFGTRNKPKKDYDYFSDFIRRYNNLFPVFNRRGDFDNETIKKLFEY